MDAITNWFKKEQKQNRKKIDIFVKEELFCVLKFIPSGKMMLYSSNKRSMCQMVCKALNVPLEQHQFYWEKYYRCAEKSLNAARNDSVAAIKKLFLKVYIN